MGQIDEDLLKLLAKKYIWWKTQYEAIQIPDSIIAQVMNIRDCDDMQALNKSVSEGYLPITA